MNREEAQAITQRIRLWVDNCPVDDVVRAYEGRVWLALDYPSWAEWCDGELGGFKLPVPQRQALIGELVEHGMSGEAIAEVVGVSPMTVSRDKRGLTNVRPDRVIGQDGKSYPVKHEPTQREPETVVVSTPQIQAESKLLAMLGDEITLLTLLEAFERECLVVEGIANKVAAQGPYGDPAYVDRINKASAALTNAQIAIMSSVVERQTR